MAIAYSSLSYLCQEAVHKLQIIFINPWKQTRHQAMLGLLSFSKFMYVSIKESQK